MKEMNTNISKDGFGASQDITAYVDYAKQMRSEIDSCTTFRSFCIIPDIVAIDINLKHKIDVHNDEQMRIPAITNKLRNVIKHYYPHLLTGGIINRFSLGDK